MDTLFFAYGSLQPGSFNYDRFANGLEVVGGASVSGRLYWAFKKGSYPYLVLGDEGPVQGTVMLADDRTWSHIVSMELGAGYELRYVDDVAVFHWARPVDERLRIASGDWLNAYRDLLDA